ncbi:MAG: hypothetical protein ACE5L7_10275, partial [Candidatus Aminicenantales bacterium]
QSGQLMRKPSGGERARFLGKESEPRNKRIFVDLFSKSIRGSKKVCPFGRRANPEKGRQRAFVIVGRGKAKLFPSTPAAARGQAPL